MVLKKISHETLKQKLQQGAQKFYFRKVKGELRIALGTLDLSRIPNAFHPKGGKISDKQVSYFDLTKGAWRSVSVSQEIWVD
jgi:hypothetical protein